MRGSLIGRGLSPHSTAIGSVPFQTLFPSFFSVSSAVATFSTSAAGGGGRGRCRGRGAAVKPDSDYPKPESNEPPFPSGLGHGRGIPSPTQHSPPILPSFSSWTTSVTPPPYAAAGRGRAASSIFPQPSESGSQSTQPQGPRKPIASSREEGWEMAQQTRPRVWGRGTEEPVGKPLVGNQQANEVLSAQPLKGSEMVQQTKPRVWGRGTEEPVGKPLVGNQQGNDVLPAQPQQGSEMVQQTRPRVWGLSRGAGERAGKPVNNLQANGLVPTLPSVDGGAGRGRPAQQWGQRENLAEENRHLRAAPATGRGGGGGSSIGGHIQAVQEERPRPASPKLNREEAVKAAMGILSRGETPGRGGGRGGGGGGGGGRGRGKLAGGRSEVRRGGGRRGRWREDDDDADVESELYLGDNADGEKLAERLGVEKMNKMHEAFEEMSSRVLPSPMDEAYKDALYTNYLIECEPEWLMEEFGTNPDIDETPPISLRDALEKVKPFVCAYENIRSQEEWEEAVEEAMLSAPNMKEIVDHCSGPDRITAKSQQEELESVVKTLPESAPAYIKRFANHTVQCLQSNAGWKFHQKCQFMDMLVREVSDQCK